jgi:hypothetical protein
MDRASADRPPAIAIARRTQADYAQRINECRVSRGYLALPALLDEIEAELPQISRQSRTP